MKKSLSLLLALLVLAGASFAGVVKSSKSQIVFKGFGTFTSTMTDRTTAERRLTDMTSDFKGKGLLGGLAAKTILRSGRTGELTDLPGLTISQIDHKGKSYTVTPMEKWAETQKQMQGGPEGNEPAEKRESDIRIVKNEFKVEDTGEAKAVNGFDCRKFLALWTVDWENVKTGEKGQDKLETIIWTTPFTGELKAAQAEETAFFKSYLKAVGVSQEKFQQDVLGTQWINLLASFDPVNGQSKMTIDQAKLAREMGKIQGYPIVIDGRYSPAPKSKAAEGEEQGGGGIGGTLGKLGKGLLKKKPNPEEEKAPMLSFYTEVLSLKAGTIDAAEMQVPADYKKK